MLNFCFYAMMTIFIVLCIVLMMLVLLQKGRGGGLSGAFGGGGSNTAFGAKTGDVLTWATSIVFGLFIIAAIVLNLVADHMDAKAQALAAAQAASQQTSSPVAPAAPGSGGH